MTKTPLYDTIDILYGNPMSVLSDCLRSFITAAPQHDLIVADFANIEGRGLAWLAGEEWKLQAFRDYDAGKAPDIYIQTYARSFNIPLFPKKDPRRELGKKMELSSGYQGGHGAYLKMGVTGKLLAQFTAAVVEAADEAEWRGAERKFNGSHDLPKDQWTALRIVVDRWRASHPATVQYWWDLEAAAIEAVDRPGQITTAGAIGREIKFLKKGSFLFARLPSGRRLSYPFAQLKDVEMPWRNDRGEKVFKPQLHYMTVDSVSKQWGETSSYGGKLCENVTQAICRDLLASAMVRVEAAQYPVIGHVHDEIISEVPEGFGTVEEFEETMCQDPGWASGFPIAAEGFRGRRYRK